MIYTIGDIHGCLSALQALWEVIDIQKSDTVVLLGDYIDRGPSGPEVLDWIIKKQQKYNIITLRGNHDIYMLEGSEDPELFQKWMRYGGDVTLESYGVSNKKDWLDYIPENHLKFLDQTLPLYEMRNYIFVHGGLQPGVSLDNQPDEALFWKKYYVPEKFQEGKTVLCGHTSRKNGEIYDFGHTICLDTYAYGGKWLTCLNLDTGHYWQANQKKKIRKRHLRTSI